ncbi:MAG: hypothetical protein ABIW38_10215 [Ferruginibacter sp.]
MKRFIAGIFLLCFLFATPAFSQKNTPASRPAMQVKQKIYTTLDGLTDSSGIAVADAERMIALPLLIQDAKKYNYSISSYQFMYMKKGVTEDEQTGKVTPVTSAVSNIFKTTPLSPIWIKSIQEQVKPGDELFFFDIIVKDAAGKLHYAPTLRLIVKG